MRLGSVLRFQFLAFPVLACVSFACSTPPLDDTRDYATRVAAGRAEKDAMFQNDDEPIPEARKAEFLPLAYFPIQQDYKVPAILKPSNDPTVVLMPTSTGQTRRERRAATLEFTLKGQQMALTAFVDADAPNMNRLFVPFSDMTSGTETYAAGRYLDLDRTPTGIYEVDFNLAYSPYCYFNVTYECPYPPAENRLKVPIRAGEKLRQ